MFVKTIRNVWLEELEEHLAVRKIHHEFVSVDQTGKRHYYRKFLQRLKVQVRRKRPERLREHRGHVPSCAATPLQQFCDRQRCGCGPPHSFLTRLTWPLVMCLFPRMNRSHDGLFSGVALMFRNFFCPSYTWFQCHSAGPRCHRSLPQWHSAGPRCHVCTAVA